MSNDEFEQNLIPISALNHFAYCPRRCALIHVEQRFAENMYTMRGQDLHKIVDQPELSGIEDGIYVERAVPLRLNRLGLIGKADVIEFHDNIPYPIEYKSGPRKQHDNDDLQLCAQALCLEEMTKQAVPRGAIYHHQSRRRREVSFDTDLREQVVQVVAAIREVLQATTLPPPVNDTRCDKCSLKETCMPELLGQGKRTSQLLKSLYTIAETES